MSKEINTKLNFNVFKHVFDNDIVTTNRNSLVTVVKIVIIKG
ncbi:Uncharacterised protein [Mycobacterium tuberculosis]|nr:Uncharacterised protein [Mycobacterium tuberculosis]